MTHIMQKNSSAKATSSWDGQNIIRLSWNSKVHYRVHKNPLLNDLLSQLNVVYVLISYFLHIHFNNILLSTRWSLLKQ
jgi:hypothetical protein